jgi:hypothetical protein
MNLKNILTQEEMHKRHVSLQYVNNKNQVESVKVDLHSAKRSMPDADWNTIIEASLRDFSEKQEGFKAFFTLDSEKVDLASMPTQFVMNMSDRICSLNGQTYILGGK